MTEEKYTSKRITCRRCNNTARFLDLGTIRRDIEEAQISYSWNILICEQCQEETIERRYTDFGSAYPDPTEEDENNYYIESDSEIIYPSDTPEKVSYEPSIDMQKLSEIAPNVARAFEIAINTISAEPTASAVFVRKSLECVYKDRAKALGFGGKEPSVLGGKDGKLKRLLDETVISQELYNIANGLKDIGNDVVHEEEFNEILLEDAIKLLDISEKVLKHIYQPLIDVKILEEIKRRGNSKGKKV